MDEAVILDPSTRTCQLDGRDVSDVVVTISDVMAAGHCVRGAKRWFEGYELDFKDFLGQGISAFDFLSTGDGIAVTIVRHKLGMK